jgi:hypothetical protein
MTGGTGHGDRRKGSNSLEEYIQQKDIQEKKGVKTILKMSWNFDKK